KKFEGSCISMKHVCGVDGSYIVESLLSIDVICSTAVAVEGFFPPGKEPCLWNEPHHSFIFLCSHHTEGISNVARSLMSMKEVDLAVNSPHSVVLLDGSAYTPFVMVSSGSSYLYQNVDVTDEIRILFVEAFRKFIEQYNETISNSNPGKIYAYISKYVSTKFLSDKFNLNKKIDDRTFATKILEEGEFMILEPGGVFSGRIQEPETGNLIDYSEFLSNIRTIFFRPKTELPAIKIDVSKNIVQDPVRLGYLLSAIEYQCASPSILEPYPLFLAHETARQVRQACIAAIEAASLRTAEDLNISEVETFMNFYSYRTEGG
ncbi:MAG: DNA double-strand break repair nuclease NurA, partial [Archaeoglobaceae archaeon]